MVDRIAETSWAHPAPVVAVALSTLALVAGAPLLWLGTEGSHPELAAVGLLVILGGLIGLVVVTARWLADAGRDGDER